jgi:hypothetical protein
MRPRKIRLALAILATASGAQQCPLLGLKRTSTSANPMSAFDPYRKFCCGAQSRRAPADLSGRRRASRSRAVAWARAIADATDAARLLDSFQFKILQCAIPFARGLPR